MAQIAARRDAFISILLDSIQHYGGLHWRVRLFFSRDHLRRTAVRQGARA